MKNIKIKYPKGQSPKETYYDVNHIARFVITQDILNKCYLYQIEENGSLIKKLNKDDSPTKLSDYATEQIKKGLTRTK